MRQALIPLLLLTLAASLSGCGQRGNLYLPGQGPDRQDAANLTPSA